VSGKPPTAFCGPAAARQLPRAGQLNSSQSGVAQVVGVGVLTKTLAIKRSGGSLMRVNLRAEDCPVKTCPEGTQ